MDRTKRWIYASLGVMLVCVGAVGVVLPGLPATIFLLGATWCFARSWPWLEEKLLRNRFFAPYLRLVDGDEPMTTRMRITTIAIIWFAVLSSLLILHLREQLSVWGGALLVLAALIGSIVVWYFRRTDRDS